MAIMRALVSEYEKNGLTEFASFLTDNNYELIATSGTAKYLRDNNISVSETSSITGFKELLGGKIKTLHPMIHEKIMQGYFDIVSVDLMPLGNEISQLEDTMDLGGVALIRTAIKSYETVCVATDVSCKNAIRVDILSLGQIREKTRRMCAIISEKNIIEYEKAILWLLERG